MRKRLFGGLSVLIFIVIIGCNRAIIPTKPVQKTAGGYDTADYNIIFNDALRQKMLGNMPDAIRLFERALKINSKSDASCFQLSQIYQSGGDIRTALKYATRAQDLDRTNSWYVHNAGVQYYLIGRADSAIYYFEKLITLEPEREDYKLTLAGFYESGAQYEKAENIINEFIDNYGDEEELLMSLIRIYRLQRKTKDAEDAILRLINSDADHVRSYGLLAEFYKSQNREDDAIEIYNKLFETNPESVELQLSYLDFLRVTKKYDEFFAGLNGVIINDSIPLEGKGNLFTGVLNDRDILAERCNELELPSMLFASSYQNSPEAVLLVSQIFEACNKDERAISTIRDYCEKNPGNYVMWERLMFAYSSREMTDDLYTVAKFVATKFNLYPVPKLLLAYAASEREEYDFALGELNKALTLAGNQEELIIEITSLLANIYYEKGEYDLAYKTYERGIVLSPDNALMLNNYAYYLSEQDLRLKEALKMIERCLTIESNSTYLDTYAWVLYKLGKFKKAAGIMENLYRSNAMETSDHYEHYGYIMHALKDCKSAVNLWSEALRIEGTKEYLNKEIEACQKED